MTTQQQTQAPRKKRPAPRVVEVRRVEQLTPHMVRITLGGEGMDGFTPRGVAEHIRVYLPDPDSGELVLPVEGPDGVDFPADRKRPISRAYTPRRWNATANELDVDFVVHGEGPGSAWASSVKPGDLAVISGQPGGPYTPDPSLDWYVIGGDEASLPAIATLLEALPASIEARVFVEVQDESEEQPLTSPADARVTWLHRGPGSAAPGRLLASALRDVELPAGDGRVWLACEASVMRDIRRHFLDERQVDRSLLRTQGYWKAGETNHTDHDMGDDI
jgi:NADPH-dependent ferric siderophore reductase